MTLQEVKDNLYKRVKTPEKIKTLYGIWSQPLSTATAFNFFYNDNEPIFYFIIDCHII